MVALPHYPVICRPFRTCPRFRGAFQHIEQNHIHQINNLLNIIYRQFSFQKGKFIFLSESSPYTRNGNVPEAERGALT